MILLLDNSLTGSDFLDRILAAVIILFILSTISEKATVFFRKNIVPFWRKHCFPSPPCSVKENENEEWLLERPTTELTREEDQDLEKNVYRISLIMGILTAFCFNASLFDLLLSKKDPQDTLGYMGNYFWNLPFSFSRFFGVLLTGFFLSFGSKFFHELLDLLYYTKNIRRKLSDKTTYEQENLADFDDFLPLSEGKIIDMAIEQNKERIKGVEGIVGIGRGYTIEKGQRITIMEIHVENETAKNKLEKMAFSVKLKTGQIKQIPVNIVVVGKAVIHISPTPINSGISNYNECFGWGTLGGYVKDLYSNTHYAMTCYHVVKDSNDWNRSIQEKRVKNKREEKIGNFRKGKCEDDMDIAFIEVEKYEPTDYSSYRAVSDADRNVKVKMTGFVTKNETLGKITNECFDVTLDYKKHNREIKNVFVIKATNGQAFSVEGDSGAWVIDSVNHDVLGVIIGGGGVYSYAIPFAKIASDYDIQLI